MNHRTKQSIPVIADALPEAQTLSPIAARVARAVATGDVTVVLDAADCVVVGSTLKMLARQAPQPEVAEQLKRVGDALVEAGWKS